ncbi:MAG: hypothetical protein ACJLTB_13725 [Algoriphagus aquaeductus]|uniref:hypothetical protein n=1 Tax=Algoriphagus aquaeductus TaxID=475299 RepID=UPI00387A2ABA
MKENAYLLLIIFVLTVSCQGLEEPFGELETFWVYSYPIPCDPTGTTQTTCLGISRSDEFDFNWSVLERIPLEIEGFTFKPFYFQKIQVQRFKNINSKKITTKLVRILEEERDYYDLLEGNWKVKRYLGEDLPNQSFPNGQQVNFLLGIRMALSSDGCNSISLPIKKVGPNRIISFGNAMSTAKACPPSWWIKPYPGIQEIFKREGNLLIFHNDLGGEVAVWEKIN